MGTQLKVTLTQINEHFPCIIGWEKLLEAHGGLKADLDKPFPVSSILDTNSLADTLWALRCLSEHRRLWRMFGWWAATQVVHNAGDERVSSCLDVVKRYAEGMATDKELTKAREAALEAMRVMTGSAPAWAAWAAWAAVKAAAARTSPLIVAKAAAKSAAMSTAWSEEKSAIKAEEAAIKAAEAIQEAKIRSILDTGTWKD